MEELGAGGGDLGGEELNLDHGLIQLTTAQLEAALQVPEVLAQLPTIGDQGSEKPTGASTQTAKEKATFACDVSGCGLVFSKKTQYKKCVGRIGPPCTLCTTSLAPSSASCSGALSSPTHPLYPLLPPLCLCPSLPPPTTNNNDNETTAT
jgi:hypothetical protein